jgi:hypothetical protein
MLSSRATPRGSIDGIGMLEIPEIAEPEHTARIDPL